MLPAKCHILKAYSIYIQLAKFYQQGLEIVCKKQLKLFVKNSTFITKQVKEHNLWHRQMKYSIMNISRTKSDIEKL